MIGSAPTGAAPVGSLGFRSVPARRQLPVPISGFALGGFAFVSPVGAILTADPGTYVMTGSPASLKVGRLLRAYDNLILNGKFPVDTANWTVQGSDTTFVSTAGQGELALGPAASDGFAYQAVSVVPGKRYNLSAFLKPSGYYLSADPGVYVMTGVDATLTYNTAVVDLGGPWTISGPRHRAIFTVNYGGAIIVANDSSSVNAMSWVSTGFGAYEVMAHITSGTTPTGLDAFDTWFDLAVGPGPNWGYEFNTGTAKSCQFTVTIRRKSDAFVVDTTTVSLSTSGGP